MLALSTGVRHLVNRRRADYVENNEALKNPSLEFFRVGVSLCRRNSELIRGSTIRDDFNDALGGGVNG